MMEVSSRTDDAVFWQSMPQSHSMGERAFIQSLRTQIGRNAGVSRALRQRSNSSIASALALGIGDDCAILRPPAGHELLVTTDFSLETTHFRREWHTPESVGHRCLARGLSDLAAMGAKPLAAFLSLALPAELVRSHRGQPCWRSRFFDGFLALAGRYRVPLAGGDTAQSPRISAALQQHVATGLALADIVLIGSAPRNRALLRSGAKAGDYIYVTGFLGGAAAELAQLAANPRRFRGLKTSPGETGRGVANPHPHFFPEPRLAVGAWLLKNHRASSAIDISDGLSTDLHHLCEESRLAATVDAAAVLIHPIAQRVSGDNPERVLQLALNGGEDYELLFTASPDVSIPKRIAGVPITCIGQMRAYRSRSPHVLLADRANGRTCLRPLPAAGWEHSV